MRRAAKKLPVPVNNQPVIPYNHAEASKPKGIPLSEIIKLADKGLSQPEIAKLLGCSVPAICQRLQNVDLNDLRDFRDNKSTHIGHLQKRLVDTLSDADLQKMSPYQRIIGSAILEDKFMPKQQSNTTNVLAISVIVESIDKRIRKQDDTQDIVITPAKDDHNQA